MIAARDGRCQTLPAELTAHTAPVNATLYSPDQRYVVTAGADQLVKVWDAGSGDLVRTYEGHTGQVLSLAIRPDGAMLVSGSSDATIRAWDLPKTDPLRVFATEKATSRDVAVAPNGKWVVAVDSTGTARLWLLQDGSETMQIRSEGFEPTTVAVRADSNQIAGGDNRGDVRLWSPLDGQAQGWIGAHAEAITGLAYHPNNQQLVSTSKDGLLKVWQLPPVPRRPLTGHKGELHAVAVSPNAPYAVTCGDDGLRIFNTSNGQTVRSLTGVRGIMKHVAVSPNGQLIAAAGDDGLIQVWNLATGAPVAEIAGPRSPLHGVTFHPDGTRVVSVGEDGTVRFYRLPTADVVLAGHAADVVAAKTSGNGQLVATASRDQTVRLWNAATGQPVRQLTGYKQALTSLAIRNDAAEVAAGDVTGRVGLWNATNGATLGDWQAHDGAVGAMAYLASSGRLATCGIDQCLKVWRLPIEPAKTLSGAAGSVNAVATTSDQGLIAVGGADKSVRFYDGESGQLVRSLPALPDVVNAVSLARDGKRIATGTGDGIVRWWNVENATPWTGEVDGSAIEAEFFELAGHQGAVVDLQLLEATGQVVTAGKDGTIRLWDQPTPPELLERVGGSINAMTISPDGKQIALAGMENNKPAVLVREAASGKLLHTLTGHEGPVTSLAFDSTGSRLISGSADKSARLWSLPSPETPRQVVRHEAAVTRVAFNDAGDHFFTAAADNVVRCWRTGQDEVVRELSGHTGAVTGLYVAGKTLISASADGSARIWTWQDGTQQRAVNHGSAISSLAVSPDATSIATGGADNRIRVWNVADGKSVATAEGQATPVIALRYLGDASQIASLGTDGVHIWDAPTGRRREHVRQKLEDARGLALSGSQFLVGRADGSLRRFSPRMTRLIDAHEGGVTSISATPDGARLLSGGADKVARWWNLADGAILATLTGSSEVVADVVAAPDGKRALAACRDKVLRIWELPEGVAKSIQPTFERSFSTPLNAIDVASETGWVAIVGDDPVVRVWDPATDVIRETFRIHSGPVRVVKISSDGSRVASGGDDKTAQLSAARLIAMEKFDAAPLGLAAASPGDRLVTAAGSEVRVWKVGPTGIAVERTLSVPEKVTAKSLSLRADGKTIAVLDQRGNVHQWSLASGELERSFANNSEPAAPRSDSPLPDVFEPTADCLKFSADGTKLIVVDVDQLRILDAETGDVLQRLAEATRPLCVALSPDQQALFVGRVGTSNNASRRLVSYERSLIAHQGRVTHLAAAPGSQTFATAGADRQIHLWNFSDGKRVLSFAAGEREVVGLAISPSANRLLAACKDRTVLAWPTSGEQIAKNATSPIPPVSTWDSVATPRRVAVSGDGTRWAVCDEDGAVRVRDLATGKQLQRFVDQSGGLRDVRFSQDNKTLVSIGEDGGGDVWTMNLLRWTEADPQGVLDLAIAVSGTQAATVGESGVQQWNLANLGSLRRFDTGDTHFVSVAARNDNAQLAAADAQGNVNLWNLGDGQPIASFRVPAAVSRLRYSPDNQKLAAVCVDNQIRFFDPADGKETYSQRSPNALVGLAFATDSRSVVTGGEKVSQWLYASPVALRSTSAHGNGVYGLSFSPDGRTLASCGADRTVKLWDPTTGALQKQLTGHQGAAYSVAFNPDSSLLVSCGADNSVRLWDTLGGRQLKQIPVGEGSLYTVSFFPDGKRVATAGLDRKIYVVDALSGQLQHTLEQHPDYLYRLTMNASGTRMLSCGYGGNVMLWNTANLEKLWSEAMGRVANYADLAPDGSRVVVAGSDGKIRFLDVPAADR